MDVKIFARTIEHGARDQIDLLLAQEPFKDCKVRIMPDVHAGMGCVIGFTANLGNKVIPNIVGVDIGCGMYVVPLGRVEIDYGELDACIRELIPSGMNVRERPLSHTPLFLLNCYSELRNTDWIERSIGTLGGGNHFIEIDEADDGFKYLVIHSGSRNLGKQVAEIYQNLAVKRLHSGAEDKRKIVQDLKAAGMEKEIQHQLSLYNASKKDRVPKDLCWLEGYDRDLYLDDMRFCQTFAEINRETIASEICLGMGWILKPAFEPFHTIHNYVDDDNMVRKGAVSARYNERLIIPINMRDGCLLCRGLGNEDWNCSAPHGAGRIMSRMQARKTLSLSEYQNSMNGIFTTSVCEDTIDEAPQVYKPIDEIMNCIGDTVRIEKIIKPVYNFKAKE